MAIDCNLSARFQNVVFSRLRGDTDGVFSNLYCLENVFVLFHFQERERRTRVYGRPTRN